MGMSAHPIVFYDGKCGLCNRAVRFILRHDKKGKIHFATLQSELGQRAQNAVARLRNPSDSVILFEDEKYYTESAAALRIAARLDGPWRWLRFLKIVPSVLRNAVYRFIAKHRYQWFGRNEACMLPTPELQQRFIGS